MDSKKPGMLQHLRQKMLPRFRRGKLAVQLDPTIDQRMCSSVPDMRDMRQVYAHSSSSTQLHQPKPVTYSSPSSPFVKPARGPEGGGSGLKMRPVGVRDGRSEHRLSVPVDSTDWASSQESFNNLCEDDKSSLEMNYRDARGMEPEELALPEMMTVYSPELPTVDVSQVQTPYLKCSVYKMEAGIGCRIGFIYWSKVNPPSTCANRES